MLGPERVRYLAARDRSSTERVSYLALVGRSTLYSSRAGASGRFRTSLQFPFRQDDHFLLFKSPNVSKYLQKLQRMLQHLIKTYMDLGHLLLNSVDVDEYGWTVVGTFNLWEQGISLDANQPCIRKWKHWDGRWRICFNTQHARASEWTVRS
ncbi:hypothetical protein F2Q68_00038813 [Brassica cretica]|uniref:Uncharacterized protein n=1 Tax=Brassica cretica TaxID=69181 RepID=A0A8S9MQD1_BRACR|nr:hypothetical protein F2Q68_00038813 [Brassica cretica]